MLFTLKKNYNFMRYWIACAIVIATHISAIAQNNEKVPPVVHPKKGVVAQDAKGDIKLTITAPKHNFAGCGKENRDTDVWSPKSVHFHPNGKKYYINSLEGCLTLVYDATSNRKLKVIKHRFNAKNAALWSKPCGLFPFTHYKKNLNTFWGRPVESTFSHNGRYLWVPYYRRSYDINAQDPSAIAIIDTHTDSIIKVMETGPLPKMVATSNNGKYLSVTHWGDNTVGLIDISSNEPAQWHYVKCVTIDHKLKLNFSLTKPVDRDMHSGYLLRGTVFTPNDRYLLVGCMGGGGGIAVIDLQSMQYLGRLTGIYNARHLLIKNGYLYASLNVAGVVQRLPLNKIEAAIQQLKGKTAPLKGWETCKVGGGARTISASPSGHYIFAACNSASKLCVVDTRTMKMVTGIAIDSYPVGLDIASDGRHIIVTSQGRKGHGGNAINIITADYATPEPNMLTATIQPQSSPVATTSTSCQAQQSIQEAFKMPWVQLLTIAMGIAVVVVIVLLRIIANKHKNKKQG